MPYDRMLMNAVFAMAILYTALCLFSPLLTSHSANRSYLTGHRGELVAMSGLIIIPKHLVQS